MGEGRLAEWSPLHLEPLEVGGQRLQPGPDTEEGNSGVGNPVVLKGQQFYF